MKNTSRGTFRIVVLAAFLLAVIVASVAFRAWKRSHIADITAPPAVAATQPDKPKLLPKTRPADAPRDSAFLDVVRATYPEFPATQALGVPLELSQAAHLHLHDPIYLGGLGRMEMWITRKDAPPIENVLKDAVDQTKDLDAHVIRERVAFVHWMPDESGIWPPYLICPNIAGKYEVISAAHGRQILPDHFAYHWENAMSWNDKVIVPTTHGVSIFHFGRSIVEDHHELIAPGATTQPAELYSEPRFLLDSQGLLAWQPWEAGKLGGLGAAHYVETSADESTGAKASATWTDLTPGNGWPAKLLHLVPLLDGTVLMLTVDDHGAVQVQFNSLVQAAVKQEEIEKLVDQLGDTDQPIRNAAYDKLSQYGSGIWPILEKLLPDQGPEAQSRMRLLLKQKVVPTLNGMTLLGSKTLNLVARLADGGTVFYAEAGVSIPNLDDPDAGPQFRVPAWISIRPGRAIELLPDALTADLTPGQSRLYANGNDWIVSNDLRGPRRFVGNGFVTLLRKSEHDFSEFAGLDRRGRWLFHRPAAQSSTTQPATSPAIPDDETLIIDPTLPDPIPRLPVWVVDTADESGWTKDGWPVTKKNSAYALHEHMWQALEEKEEFLSKPDEVPPQVEPAPANSSSTTLSTTIAATLPATVPAASPTTTQVATTQNSDMPILTDRQGTQYFGGLTDLRLVPVKGAPITWPLPALANGAGPVWLVRTRDGRLFLFNQPGRVVGLKPTPGAAEPFKLEKIFTHHVPTAAAPTRIWLDPAGRIAMTWENKLAIFFPDGYIPPSIAEMMMLGGQDEMEE